MWGFLLLVGAALAYVGESPVGAADDKGTVVELGGLKSKVPANWKSEEVPEKYRQMRVMQFQIPKTGDDKTDAQLIIFYFGEGGGGDIEGNINRWKGMFDPPEGKKIDDVSKVEKLKAGDVSATYLDVQGTYKERFPPFDPNAKITKRPDYRLLGVIFECKKGPYYIRMIGPNKTVESNKKGLEEWVKAFK
jgi:hypothetical protein